MSEVRTADSACRDSPSPEAACRIVSTDSALMVAIRRWRREIERSEVVTVGHDAIIFDRSGTSSS